MTVREAAEVGAKTLVIGVANRGGEIPDVWHEALREAARIGMDVASGLHKPLSNVPGLIAAAETGGAALLEVRRPTESFPIGDALTRTGRRVLSVGTDCSVGKMYTCLALERELAARGESVDFRATGQTGILIDGKGVAVDAVVSDFISGAIEQLCPAAADNHWDVIEGQGSLFHPSFAGVSLGLLHGAQPRDLVLCHEPTRTHLRGLPHQSLPSVQACIDANLAAAAIVSPHVRFVGVAVNTSAVDESAAAQVLERLSRETGLPAVDPLRDGVAAIVDRMLS
jgi:uncharacterized NAD-dependent epimerase/dehydratase family protein